jgi:hypothetical protein
MRRLAISTIPFVLLGAVLSLALALSAPAQIPKGFVQTTGTITALANGKYQASWTNLSSSSQLPLLGGVSTFQQTVSGSLDGNGFFSVLLADTSQVTPSPSTWTFSFTYNCPPTNTGFTVQVAVVGGGGTEDISSQVIAALPSNPCSGGSGGQGTVNPGQLALAQYPKTSQTVVSPANFTYDAATGNNLTIPANTYLASSVGGAQPLLDIRHPSFSGGAVCDNSTDIGPALQAAITALPSTGGEILIPGSPTPCYWNPGTSPLSGLTSKTGAVTFYVQGQLHTETTIEIPNTSNKVNFIGRSGAAGQSFQGPGQAAVIVVRPKSKNGYYSGTLGTAVSTTPGVGSVVTFTPPGGIVGLYANTTITVGETISCSLASVSRASGKVTASISSACHIPPNMPVTVAGVTDSSFNGAFAGGGFPQNFVVTAQDYCGGSVATCNTATTLVWNQTGATATSSGGTVTGFNEDLFENVHITSCATTTCTATFYRSHASTAQWAIDGIDIDDVAGDSKLFKDFRVVADGTGIFDEADFKTTFENIGIGSTQNCNGNVVNWPFAEGLGSFITLRNVGFDTGCNAWGIRMYQPFPNSGGGSGPMTVKDYSYVMGGVKMDSGAAGLVLDNMTCEQCGRGVVQIDPTNYVTGIQQIVTLSNEVGVQDNGNGTDGCSIYQLTPVLTGTQLARPIVSLNSLGSNFCVTNQWFTGKLNNQSPQFTSSYDTTTNPGIRGTFNDGLTTDSDDRGRASGMGPSVIPYATLNTVTSPASWPTSSCSVATGTMAPDGTLTAGTLTKASGSGSSMVLSYTFTPAVGDYFIAGVWVYDSADTKSDNAGGEAMLADNAGSSHYGWDAGSQANSNASDSQQTDDWYHPVVWVAHVATSDGTSGQLARFFLTCAAGFTQNYWQPFVIYIPASANVPLREINRWRQQLMHGAVPPNWNNPGVAVTAEPLVASSLNVFPGRGGTFVCTAGGTITIANTNELATSDVIFSLNTAGGTITTPPAMKTVTAGTGFAVLCGASDTSTYNYVILN